MDKVGFSEEVCLNQDICKLQKLHENIKELFKKYQDQLPKELNADLINIYNNFFKNSTPYTANLSPYDTIFTTLENQLEMIGSNSIRIINELNNVKSLYSNLTNSITIAPDIYINSTILMSAAPRKDKDNDTELGEDTSGIVNNPFGTFFWVFDGTSDSPNITKNIQNNIQNSSQAGLEICVEENKQKHIFSSRVLAQLLSANVAKVVCSMPTNNTLNLSNIMLHDILTKALISTTNEIAQNITQSGEEVINNIKKSIANKIIPYCSTTVLLGFFAKSGDLQYIILGDSDVYAYKKNENSLFQFLGKDDNNNPSRLFLFISSQDNELFIKENIFDYKIRYFERKDVDLLFACSDGVGISSTALQIATQPQQVFWHISRANQGTYDDKTLLMLDRQKINSHSAVADIDLSHESTNK